MGGAGYAFMMLANVAGTGGGAGGGDRSPHSRSRSLYAASPPFGIGACDSYAER